MTPPRQRKSRLAQRGHYAAAEEPAPAAEPAAPPSSSTSTTSTSTAKKPVTKATGTKATGTKKPVTEPAGPEPVVKTPRRQVRPEPPAGTEEYKSYWPAGTYQVAVAAYQVMQDEGAAPDAFNEWFAEQLDAFARMSVTERVEAVRGLPQPPSGRGQQRAHHIPSSIVRRLEEAVAADREQLGVDRKLGAFGALAGRWASEKVRQHHHDRTGAEQLPPARPLPRGRRPAPRRD